PKLLTVDIVLEALRDAVEPGGVLTTQSRGNAPDNPRRAPVQGPNEQEKS
ncbi:unnamed protein product, partial [marine sediment metagenome]